MEQTIKQFIDIFYNAYDTGNLTTLQALYNGSQTVIIWNGRVYTQQTMQQYFADLFAKDSPMAGAKHSIHTHEWQMLKESGQILITVNGSLIFDKSTESPRMMHQQFTLTPTPNQQYLITSDCTRFV